MDSETPVRGRRGEDHVRGKVAMERDGIVGHDWGRTRARGIRCVKRGVLDDILE